MEKDLPICFRKESVQFSKDLVFNELKGEHDPTSLKSVFIPYFLECNFN